MSKKPYISAKDLNNTEDPIEAYARWHGDKPYTSAINDKYAKAMIDKYQNEERTPEDIIMEANSTGYGEVEYNTNKLVADFVMDDQQPLTREHIEGEGWEVHHDDADGLYKIFTRGDANLGIRFDTGGSGVSRDGKTVFSGTISTLHQFRTLMQMLDIK